MRWRIMMKLAGFQLFRVFLQCAHRLEMHDFRNNWNPPNLCLILMTKTICIVWIHFWVFSMREYVTMSEFARGKTSGKSTKNDCVFRWSHDSHILMLYLNVVYVACGVCIHCQRVIVCVCECLNQEFFVKGVKKIRQATAAAKRQPLSAEFFLHLK
jgi:hypothetical protein